MDSWDEVPLVFWVCFGDVSYQRFYGLIKNFFVNVEVILLLDSNIELFIKFNSNVLSSSLCFDCRMVRCMVKSSAQKWKPLLFCQLIWWRWTRVIQFSYNLLFVSIISCLLPSFKNSESEDAWDNRIILEFFWVLLLIQWN